MKYLFTFFILTISSVLIAQDITMQTTTVSQCGGVFYDSGGEFANYGNDENFVLTICPENPGQKIQLEFIEFNTQLNADIVTIFDGDDITAPPIGDFSGANNPGLVEASDANTSGCITVQFVSNGSANASGWVANISCRTPCQDITAQLDSTVPDVNSEGEVLICAGGDVTFNGSAIFSANDDPNATYEWDFGNSTTATGQSVVATYNEPGIFVVDLVVTDTNPLGCSSTNSISQVVRVSPEIDFTGTEATDATICFGESTTITGVATIPQFEDCAPEIFDQTWLEDTPSTGQDTSYSSTITVDCYGPGQVLTDITQITDFCAVMEHSFMGDLSIILQAPNGAQVMFLEYGDGTDPGDNLGIPDQADNGNPGTGLQYCFSPTATQTLDDAAATGNDIPAGTYAALPSSSFDNLLGSPLNGDWTFIIIDSWAADDGTLFSWNLNFDPSLVPPSNSVVSEEWDADPTITNTNGNIITVTPPTAGEFCYTYRASDDFGCEYTQEVCIEVLPEIVTETPNDLFVCDSGTPPYIFDLETNTAVVLASAANASDLVVTYHNSQADADADVGAIADLNNYSGTDGEIIYIRVEYLDSGCYEVLSFTLNVAGQPNINPVPDLELCDDVSNDGVEEFDLSVQTLGILGAQAPTDFNVTYHLTFDGADNGTGALPNLYTNGGNPEPIYVRVESIGDSNCYNASANPVFSLIVNPRAIANQPADMEACDDISNDGFATFDLSTQETFILGTQDPTTYDVSFHPTQDDANFNTGALPTNYTNVNPNTETIFVRVQDPANPDCYGTTSFNLIVNPLPDVMAVTPLQVCDGEVTDGFAPFNLTDKVTEILNGQTDVNVSFHETPEGADMDTAEIFDGYVNTTPNNQTIHVRLEDAITGCYNVGTLALEVLGNPVANMPIALEECDDDLDSFVEFTLSDRDAEVIGAQTGVVVTYHSTPEGAIDGTGVLPNAYVNTTANTEEVYVRIENGAGCYDTTTLQLIVNPLPSTVEVSPYELCDDNAPGDEQEQFDLTDKEAEILNGQGNVTVTYYTDAANTNEITGLYTNVSNPETIYAVLTNDNTGCSTQVEFELIVNPLPALVAPTPLEVCDDGTPDGLTEIDLNAKNGEISGGNPNYSVSYYFDLDDAEAEENPLAIPYTNISDPQTIYVRVEDIETGCYDTTTLVLDVQQAPAANTPTPLYYCDPDNDGFGIFDLTEADNEITGGAAGLTVTYHETPINAWNNVDAIDTTVAYTNISEDVQTIYVRVESATIATECASFVNLELVVQDTPQLIEPTPLEACDDASADGFAQFDLTSKEEELLNGADPTLYNISYYETEENANDANNPIANPMAYINTVANEHEVWVRVEDPNTAEGCYKVVRLELIVNPLPVLVQPMPLEECDVNNPGDEQEAFMLEDANEEILNGQNGISLTYYETEDDANNAENPISSPYVNTMNAQTIYVRAENDVTGCYSTITLTLRVNPIPSPEEDPDPIEVCDDDNDGFAEFDLEIRTVEIINGETDVVITYHETEEEAEQGTNAITGLYTNIVAGSQMIYVRSENTITGCYSLTQNTLELIVVSAPEVPTNLEALEVCDTDNDGFAPFDLTERNDDILGDQDPSEVVLTYHVTDDDAETGDNPIVNVGNYTNTMNPQTIYVRLYNPTTGCQDTGAFEIIVQLPPEPVQPTPLEVCDDLDEVPGDEITEFDLTVKDSEITGGNASWSVAYYETSADAQSQTNAIPDPTAYTNTSVNGLAANPQTLYVVVTDTDTGCTATTTMTIRVLPNPTPTPSDQLPDLELCDDINTGDGVEVFDLTENEILILNGENGVTPTYHESSEDAYAGENAIADPTQYTNIDTPEQEIYVRVTNDATGCYAVVNFTIFVHPLPEVVAVTDFIQCELNTDGFDSFDLTIKDDEVLNGQDPTRYIVSYHETLADAESEMNALVSPYTNISNPQEIYVTITDNETGCSISTQRFNLQVDEAAQANPDMLDITYEACDDDIENNGDPSDDSTQFTLSTRDEFVLDGQDPANYIVTYYATEADANLNVNPLPDLYENVVNPQVIYARVDNNTLAVIPIALDLTALTAGLDLDANGTVDTYDTDADGVFDLIDVDGDGLSDGIDANADGLYEFVDIDGDGNGDPVDLNNDGVFDNQQDGSICYEVAPLTLQVNPKPNFDLAESYILCIDTNGTEILDPLVLDTGLSDADYSFEWTFNGEVIATETSSSMMPTQGGAYGVLVTDMTTSTETYCETYDETIVIESAPPTLIADVVTQVFGNSNVIEALATGISEYEYSLDGGPWEEPLEDGSIQFTGVSQGLHTVTARDKNGCGITSIEVFVIDYPKYFTPNGDGIHETWNIEGIGSNAKIYIFDRYGKLLKQISPTGQGWDGTFNGNNMPSSDYWFTVEYEEPLTNQIKEFKAHFTLRR